MESTQWAYAPTYDTLSQNSTSQRNAALSGHSPFSSTPLSQHDYQDAWQHSPTYSMPGAYVSASPHSLPVSSMTIATTGGSPYQSSYGLANEDSSPVSYGVLSPLGLPFTRSSNYSSAYSAQHHQFSPTSQAFNPLVAAAAVVAPNWQTFAALGLPYTGHHMPLDTSAHLGLSDSDHLASSPSSYHTFSQHSPRDDIIDIDLNSYPPHRSVSRDSDQSHMSFEMVSPRSVSMNGSLMGPFDASGYSESNFSGSERGDYVVVSQRAAIAAAAAATASSNSLMETTTSPVLVDFENHSSSSGSESQISNSRSLQSIPKTPARKRRNTKSSDVSETECLSKSSGGKVMKRVGGRRKGSHLNAAIATQAKEMRKQGACWVCLLQRETCTPSVEGEPCGRCKNREERNHLLAGAHLTCCREKLTTFHSTFVTNTLHDPYLPQTGELFERSKFVNINMLRPFRVNISLIYGQRPISVDVYEYQPVNPVKVARWCLNDQKQYIKNIVDAAPIALDRDVWANSETLWCRIWLDAIIRDRTALRNFGETCYQELPGCLSALFQHFMDYEPDSSERSIYENIYRMLLCAHILGHAAYLTHDQVARLSPFSQTYFHPSDNFASPGLVNRELKTKFMMILNESVMHVLTKLQGILRGSAANTKWLGAFMCMLGLAFAIEELQSTTDNVVELMLEHDGIMPKVGVVTDKTAHRVNQGIDDTFHVMIKLFNLKYKNFRPLVNPDDPAIKEKLGAPAIKTIKAIRKLCQQQYEPYLSQRQYATASKDDIAKYFGRQVSRFLCSFWSPEEQ